MAVLLRKLLLHSLLQRSLPLVRAQLVLLPSQLKELPTDHQALLLLKMLHPTHRAPMLLPVLLLVPLVVLPC
jgi:hypothetical protein